jgi:hypothetical protein
VAVADRVTEVSAATAGELFTAVDEAAAVRVPAAATVGELVTPVAVAV